MSWLFGVKKPDYSALGGGGPEGSPPSGAGDDGSGDKKRGDVGAKSEYRFDSTALERAAQAAKDLERSKYAKEAMELSKMQEQTRQLEYQKAAKELEAAIEQARVEGIRTQQEEQRKTLAEQARMKQQLAQYEDQLSRKRYDDQLGQQARMNEENLRRQEESVERQETSRRSTMQYEADLRHKNDMLRIEAELKGRGKVERENHDLRMDELRVNAAEYRKTVMESIGTIGSVVGAGLKTFLGDFDKVVSAAAAVTLLAGGFYVSKFSAGMAIRFAEARLGKPSLIRETSRVTPLQLVKSPIESAKKVIRRPVDVMQGIILKPELEHRLRDLAIATRQTKRNRGFYRNVLFYGPPGTGKTLFAKSLALNSGLDYALMTGGDIAPLGASAVTAIHSVFEWSRASRRGLLLFIDEADAFLRKRSHETMEEGVRAALNAFLYHTGDHSKRFMLVLASNQPEQFDWAINDRLDDMVRFDLPGVQERDRLLRLYFEKHLLQVAADRKSRLRLDDGVDWSKKCAEIAARVDTFSGREIAKLAIAWQASAFASEDGRLTVQIVDRLVAEAMEAHANKLLWRDYRVGQDTSAFHHAKTPAPLVH